MFGQSGFDTSASGMFGSPLQMYFSGLNQMSENMGPMKGFARWQLEVAGLMSRRAQAYMEIPSRMSRCRTPQDLMSEQMRFWQNAFQQHSESSKKIMDAWTQMMTPMSFQPAGNQKRERDYISFNDPKDANGQARGPRDRRAA